LRRRRKSRELVMGIPSRFILEMKLHESVVREDLREKLKRLREAFAVKGAASSAAQAADQGKP
jgi:ATP-dependent DNA helicase Rep